MVLIIGILTYWLPLSECTMTPRGIFRRHNAAYQFRFHPFRHRPTHHPDSCRPELKKGLVVYALQKWTTPETENILLRGNRCTDIWGQHHRITDGSPVLTIPPIVPNKHGGG